MKHSQERVLRELTQDAEFHKRQKDASFAGYHKFLDPLDEKGAGHGSFEVWHNDPLKGGLYSIEPGWYWWPCFPGCLPDGEPSGPFPTAEGAYLDAIGE